MNLREFIEWLGANPAPVFGFFLLMPLTALVASILGRNEGHLAPWKYLYSTLVYLACIPGVFSVALSVYLFLFEKRSIMEMDMYTQVLPVISMLLTLMLIRRNVQFQYIPGFDRISSMMMMIGSTFVVMWLLDRTRVYVFSYMPIQYLALVVIALLLVFRYGLGRMFR